MDDEAREKDRELRREFAQLRPVLELQDAIERKVADLGVFYAEQQTVLSMRADICRHYLELQERLRSCEGRLLAWLAKPLPLKVWTFLHFCQAKQQFERSKDDLIAWHDKLSKFDQDKRYVFERIERTRGSMLDDMQRRNADLAYRGTDLETVRARAEAIAKELFELQSARQKAASKSAAECVPSVSILCQVTVAD